MAIIGDFGVGKSCILSQFVQRKFNKTYASTEKLDYLFKYILVEESIVKLGIFDDSSRSHACLENCKGALLCYDITYHKSFENLETHIQGIKKNGLLNPSYTV